MSEATLPTTAVALIPSYRHPSYRRVEARQNMPAGALDRLLAEIICEKPDRRTVLRHSTQDHDEVVIARDRRGNERIEIRLFVADAGAYQLAAVPHIFLLKRDTAWEIRSKYGFPAASERLAALMVAAERLASALADLDADPLAHPPRSPNCMICGRHLTDATSAAVGIGPECGDRYRWLFERRGEGGGAVMSAPSVNLDLKNVLADLAARTQARVREEQEASTLAITDNFVGEANMVAIVEGSIDKNADVMREALGMFQCAIDQINELTAAVKAQRDAILAFRDALWPQTKASAATEKPKPNGVRTGTKARQKKRHTRHDQARPS